MSAVVSILCSLHLSNSLTQYFVSATVFAGTALSLSRAISLHLSSAVQNAILPPSGWGWCEGLALGLMVRGPSGQDEGGVWGVAEYIWLQVGRRYACARRTR